MVNHPVLNRHFASCTHNFWWNFLLISVRKVPDAFTMDPEEFEEQYNVKKPSKNDANIVFHCLAGVRSRAAMEAVHQIGFTK